MTTKSKGFGLLLVCAVLASGCEQKYEIRTIAPHDEQSTRILDVSSITNEFRPVVKVVLMVDNSTSMHDEQVALAQGTGKLVESLRGMNVDFFIYSSSSHDATLASQKPTHTSTAEFILKDADGRITGVTSTEPLASSQVPFYEERVTNRLNPPLQTGPSGDSRIEFRENMSDDEFAAMKDAFVNSITHVGTDGSLDETGFCTIGRVLVEDGLNAPLKKGDRVAFIVISDTNDFSELDKCTRDIKKQVFAFNSASLPGAQSVLSASGTDVQWWKYTAGFEGAPGAGTPESYLMTYDWISSESYVVTAEYPKSTYKVFSTYFNSAPIWKVKSEFTKPTYKVSYGYQYQDTCIVDEQPEPCIKNGSVSNLAFDPAQAGNPARANGACPAGLQSYVTGLLAAGQTLTSCNYTYANPASFVEQAFSPEDHGSPATGAAPMACNSSLTTLAQSLVPAEAVYTRCTYTYSESVSSASRVFDPAAYGNPPSGTGNLACPAEVKTLAQTLVPVGKTFKSCYYTFSTATQTVSKSVDPASYGLAFTSAAVACAEPLRSFAATQVPAGYTMSKCTYKVVQSATTKTQSFDGPSHGVPAGGSGAMACNDQLKTYAQSLVNGFAAGKTLRNCTYRYTAAAPGAAAPVKSCSYEDAPANVSLDLCSGSAFSGFSNLEAYLRANPSKCSGATSLSGWTYKGCTAARTGWKKLISANTPIESYIAQGSPAKILVSDALLPGSASFVDGILAKSTELFGETGFFFSAIIYDTDLSTAGCDGGYRASPGTKYRELINRAGKYASVYPICSMDYTPALNAIREFIVRTALNTFEIKIGPQETIENVRVKRGDELIEAVKGTDYTLVGGTIQFTDGFIQPSDSLKLTIVDRFKVAADGTRL